MMTVGLSLMTKHLTLLLFIGLIWGQDVLVGVDGKEFKGRLVEKEDRYLFFFPDGAKQAQKIPIRMIKEIRLSNNEILDFGNDLVTSVPQNFEIQKKNDKREGQIQNKIIPKVFDNHIKTLSPKIIASHITESMIAYEENFTGINPFLKYYGSSLAIGYFGLRLGEIIQSINDTDGDAGNFLIFSPSLMGVGYIGYLKKQHQRKFWEDERKFFIESTSNIDLSIKKRLELYNRQLSYLAADNYSSRYKLYLKTIPRVINSFLFTYSLVILENIILGDYIGVPNEILLFTTAANFVFIAPLIDKIHQKRYYEKEKGNYISGLDKNQKSIFSSKFDEKVKKSSIHNTHIAKANKNYRFSYFSSMCALVFIFLIGAINDAPFNPGQV